VRLSTLDYDRLRGLFADARAHRRDLARIVRVAAHILELHGDPARLTILVESLGHDAPDLDELLARLGVEAPEEPC